MDNTKGVLVKELNAKFEDTDKNLHVLKDISFKLKNGSFTSVIGPSGCGKSTLFSLISGLPTKDTCKTTGKIRIYGKKPETARRNREIGLILQKPTLLEWRSVEDNIKLPLEIMGYSKEKQNEKVKELLKLLELEGFEKYRPSQISGGMQQKVSVGRALAYNPDLLLMDEPFASLDAQSREDMQNLLLSLWKELSHTILFVTHDVTEAVVLADRILLMDKNPGRIREEVRVDLPRPRERESVAFLNVSKRLHQALRD